MPKWLQHLLRHQEPDTAEQAGVFVDGTGRRNLEVIRLPRNGLLLGRDNRFFSTFQPSEAVQAITLPNGNRLFPHDNYIISTAGLKPRSGDIAHPHGAGCSNRAFCNLLDMEQPHDEHARGIFSLAPKPQTIEELWFQGDVTAESFREVSPQLMGQYAAGLGLQTTLRPTGNLDEILRHEGSGIIAAETTRRHLGGHLVAFRDGKQIITDPSQLIKDRYLYDYRNDYDYTKRTHIPETIDNTRLMFLITRGDPQWATAQQRAQEYHVAENSDPDAALRRAVGH